MTSRGPTIDSMRHPNVHPRYVEDAKEHGRIAYLSLWQSPTVIALNMGLVAAVAAIADTLWVIILMVTLNVAFAFLGVLSALRTIYHAGRGIGLMEGLSQVHDLADHLNTIPGVNVSFADEEEGEEDDDSSLPDWSHR